MADIELAAEPACRPAEEDVAGGLESTLAGHHPLAVLLEGTRPEVGLQHGCLGLLDLEEERLTRGGLLEQDHQGQQPDASDAHDLDRDVLHLEAVQEVPPILLEGDPVVAKASVTTVQSRVSSGW